MIKEFLQEGGVEFRSRVIVRFFAMMCAHASQKRPEVGPERELRLLDKLHGIGSVSWTWSIIVTNRDNLMMGKCMAQRAQYSNAIVIDHRERYRGKKKKELNIFASENDRSLILLEVLVYKRREKIYLEIFLNYSMFVIISSILSNYMFGC